MTEKEKAQKGMLYDANYDKELIEERKKAAEILFDLHKLRPRQEKEKKKLFQKLLGKTPESFSIVTPFFCDYGYNIKIGNHFFANYHLVILDEAQVNIGENVFLGPNVSIYTAQHPLDAQRRDVGLEWALPVTIGDHVWLGGNVTILPGITIGNHVVIGAGSVVCSDIPSDCVAAGNPCKVKKKIPEYNAEKGKGEFKNENSSIN